MIGLLKLLGKGLLYAILLPIGIVLFSIAGVFLFLYWLVQAFIYAFRFLRGEKNILVLPIDKEVRKILDKSRDFSDNQNQQTSPQQVQLNININGSLNENTSASTLENKTDSILDLSSNKEDI